MALPQLAATPDDSAQRLASRGYVLLDGTPADRAAVLAAFDALRANHEESLRVAPDHPLVAQLLAQPAVRDFVAETLGPLARPVRAEAFDLQRQVPVAWHQPGTAETAGGLILRWHLDLIGPADGGLRVLPGSHLKGRLTSEQIAALAQDTPAVELAVSAGTVLALRPLLVLGSRRRTTQGHRRILHVELAAGDPPPPLEWAWQ